MKLVKLVMSVAIAILLSAISCAEPAETPSETPRKSPQAPIEVAEFDGFTVSLMDYHWDGNNLVTTWRFFNDRPQKNRSISLFAYDQGGNRVTSDWPIMSSPILWPGETAEKTMPWKCGSRSTEITITVREAAKWEDGTKIIPPTDAHFVIRR